MTPLLPFLTLGSLWFFAVLGFASCSISLYGRYRPLPRFMDSPYLCGTKKGECQSLFRTRTAALLGVPNSALAMIYYPLIVLGSLFHAPVAILWGISCLALSMSVWLAWVLIRDRQECRVCWVGHISNAVIWLVLLLQWRMIQ